MNYAELQVAVLSDTRAKQHETLIQRKLNAAINYISRSGKYPSDLVEIIFDTAAGVDSSKYIQALPLPARYRCAAYLQNSSCPGSKMRGYRADELAAKPGVQDVFYVGGVTFYIKHAVLSSQFLLGYYQYPAPLSLADDTNWITEELSELVIDYTSAMVLISLGEKETSASIMRFSQANLAIAAADIIDTGGRTV